MDIQQELTNTEENQCQPIEIMTAQPIRNPWELYSMSKNQQGTDVDPTK